MRVIGILLFTLLLQAPAIAAEPDALSAELQTWLDRYAVLYNRQDYQALLDMWDKDDPNVLYMAEEIDPPMRGWGLIRAYFNPRPGVQMLDGIRNRYTNVRAHLLAPDLAFASYRLDFDIKVKGQKALTSWDRVTAVFRRKGGEWKMVTYAEAPMAPLTMVRRMQQDKVPEDFDEFIKAQPPAIPPATPPKP
jgi:ketosteroid isomerase-like protein